MIKFISEKDSWDRLIGEFKDADVYHTYAYHQLSKASYEKPLLISYERQGKVAIPCLIRPIDGTDYFDLSSVYGYPGPLRIGTQAPSKEFYQVLKEFLTENKIVSVFSRLNPHITYQDTICNPLGEVRELGEVVYIDLSRPEEEQLLHYHKRLKTYIHKCRRQFEIRELKSSDEVGIFRELYWETMRRVNAKPHYFFQEGYFKDLLSGEVRSKLLFAIDQTSNEIAAGALFTMHNDHVNYHLSGVREQYLKLNPVKMLIDEARILAKSEGFKYLTLGGGVGNRMDSLFYFKSGFSSLTKTFKTWRYIHDPDVYQDLVRHFVSEEDHECVSLDFFPLYRCGMMNTVQKEVFSFKP